MQLSQPAAAACTYNLNFSFHFGDNVCGLIDVARMNLAGTGPPIESRCSRRPSFRLKLRRKLRRNLSPWCGESKLLSKPTSLLRVRGVSGGWGDTGAMPAGWMPSIQYGSLKPENGPKRKKKYAVNAKMFAQKKRENHECCARLGISNLYIVLSTAIRIIWLFCVYYIPWIDIKYSQSMLHDIKMGHTSLQRE